ncbi:Disco-interacting protein 2 -like protein C [Collichthys lucidus]|uniref:Disco-interacting protein 2-like protein C n=1 Tax=Collichthys lucidus TaxID=240159 RepID=A0A4U5VGL8_COLLU|nr:Disco-interacting protein 2 -like protein C [Collichthys lucidus]
MADREASPIPLEIRARLAELELELSEVQQPDPNQPRPEGAEMMPVRGEALGVVTNWPPSLEAALQRWGTISPKAPCLTSLDTAGKPLYVLTYAETIVNVLDFKKDVGLWHGILTSVMNMMHVISVPYSLMKVNPLSWIQKVCQYKAKVACVKSRDMHWALVAHKDQKDINLSSLRMLLVADGSNPCKVYPVSSSGGLISEYAFVRTGLLGFIGPGGLVFITGKMDGLIMVSGRRHNADDIVATALAVEPMKFVYRGRIAVFSVTVLRDERIVVVAEQRPDSTEEDSFQWMSRVLQAIDSIHGVGVFCLALVPANTLPKTPLGGIHLSEIKQLYLEGGLHPCNFLFLSEVLQWRAQTTPDHVLYTLLSSRGAVSSSLTCLQLHKRAERVAALLMERAGLQEGDHVALVYPPGQERLCLYAGCVPITVRPPHPQNISTTLPTVKMIVEVSHSACVMTTAVICKLLRSKEATATVDIRNWPPVLDTALYKPTNPDGLAYLDFSVSTTGMLAGVQMSHNAVGAFCRSVKLQCELYPSREVAICLDPYCGLGFVLWCLCSQLRVRDTFCSYSVMELCTKGLGLQTEALKARGLDLSRVRACVVVAEERPRMSLTHSFSKLFKDLGLHPRSVSTAFGCRVNLAICLQGTSGPDPTTVYVDMRALRHDRVRLVERGSPHSLPLMESGKILPGVRIIIANPETKGPLGDSHLGEIWVHSAHNGSGYYSGYGEEVLQSDHFNSRLSFGDTQTVWARTGYLGFLRRTELTDANGGQRPL